MSNDNTKLNNQLISVEEQIEEMKKGLVGMENQLVEYNNMIEALERKNKNLEGINNELSLKDGEIKLDMRVPFDVLKVVYDHFVAIEDKDINKLEETLPPNIGNENRAFQLWDYGKDNKVRLNEVSYQFENEYQSSARTTKSIVVDVKYNNDKNVSFALQNTNNEGWKIMDID